MMRVLVVLRDPDGQWYSGYEARVLAVSADGRWMKVRRRLLSEWLPVDGPFCRLVEVAAV